jgi:hypothetical protein
MKDCTPQPTTPLKGRSQSKRFAAGKRKFEIPMTPMSRIFGCLFFSFLCTGTAPVVAYAVINPLVTCENITLDDSSTFQACAIGDFTGPSPAQFENGTTIYMGGYSNNYEFVQGLEQGFDTTTLTEVELSNAKTGIVVNVGRDDYDGCTVSVTTTQNGTKDDCASCTYCGNETYTADCTNIENGRMVYCETAAVETVYFPLTEAALEGSRNATNATDAPAPSPTIVREPVSAPTDTNNGSVSAPVAPAPVSAPTTASPPNATPTTSGAAGNGSLLFVLASVASLLAIM